MKKILLITVILIVLIGLSIGAYLIFIQKPQTDLQPEDKPIPTTETEIKTEVSSVTKELENNQELIFDAKKTIEMNQKAERVIKMGNSTIPLLLEQIANQNWRVRWLAIYSLTRLSADTDKENKEKIKQAFNQVVAKELNFSLKYQMAVWLFGSGEKSTVPIILDCLNSEDPLLLSEPPRSTSRFCLSALQFFTDQTFDNTEKWQNWWGKNKDKLIWSEEQQKYVIK